MALSLGGLSGTALGQETPPAQGVPFTEATVRLFSQSPTLQGAEHSARAAQIQADAMNWLGKPVISLDVQQLRYQKTLDISLTGVKNDVRSAAGQALDFVTNAANEQGIGDQVAQIISGLQEQLQPVANAVPDTLRIKQRQDAFRPTLTVVQPLYTGGAITAAQEGARAAARLAEARGDGVRERQRLELVRLYFGQALATRALAVSQATRDGFDHHLADAHRLEQEGMISHARTLQVQVARDTAQRQVLRADNALRTATDLLTALLNGETPLTSTEGPFVNSGPIEPAAVFLAAAEGGIPQWREADAGVELANQGVALAAAQLKPTVYAFGTYNLNRSQALPTEPDWAIGIGLHFALTSSIDRTAAVEAARARSLAAESARRQARVDIRTAVIRAYDQLSSARTQYQSVQSSMVAARENLRVQELAFREGEGTAAEVIDARNALSQAEFQRATTAYEYDLALATLLAASGQGDRFVTYQQRADAEVTP